MKALIYRENKLQLITDAPLPRPSDDEVLVKVSYAGICNTDIEITKGYMGFSGILGHEFAGVIESASDNSLIGRRAVGEINLYCGICGFCRSNYHSHCPERTVLGILNRDGAFAEYLILPLSNIHLIPESVTDQEAVFVEPLAAAFQILEQVRIRPEDSVCLLGDGKLGLLIGQVVSLTGCSLTVVGKHKSKLAILERMGVHTSSLDGFVDKGFDIVIDSTGSASGLKMAMDIVKPCGTIVLKTTIAGEAAIDLNTVVINELTIIGSRCGPFQAAIDALDSKKVDILPLISRVFTLDEGVEAFEYAKQKNTLKVIIKI